MKKVVLTLALFAGSFAAVSAINAMNLDTTNVQISVSQEEYKEVKIEELSETVQNSIKALAGETSEITKLEYCEANKCTRVTLTDKENKTEKVVILNEEGKEV